jgi:N-methylhydantoinase B
VLAGADIANNAGCYRPITLHLPLGSLVNPIPPAPVNSRSVTMRRIIEVVMGALVRAIPERIHAANNGHPLMCSVGGLRSDTAEYWVTSVMATGGAGAYAGGDGAESIQTDSSNSMNIPVEAMEMDFPIRVLRWGLREGSGGAGRWRGGLGLEYQLEVLNGEAHFSHRGERFYTAPWGLFGGRPGAMAKAEIHRENGQVQNIPSKLEFDLTKGDQVHFYTTGGGGYGDPLVRDPQCVLEDVVDGKISALAAKEEYGVVVIERQKLPEINAKATGRLRHRVHAERGEISRTFDRGD